MAVPVTRVHLAMAHAAMPGLLPTPPQCKMLPLLPTPSSCAAAVILPDQSPPNKPGRADAVDRWDACKTTLIKSADAAERKITAKSSSGQLSSPKKSSSASSCERWDINKKSPTWSFSSLTSSSPTSHAAATPSRENKRPVSRGSSSSSDERWDAHKKAHRPPQPDGDDDNSEDDVQSSTGSNDMEMEVDDEQQHKQTGLYAGQGFLAVAPPEPSMLPVPAFLVLPRFVAA